MKRNSGEYLQEEVEMLAPNNEVKRFCAEVDEAREQLDRLNARVDVIDKNNKPI